MNKWIIAAVAVLVVGGAAIALSGGNSNTGTSTGKIPSSSQLSTSQKSSSNTIVYDGTSFTPSVMTVKAGSQVTIKNTSGQPLQFDSNPHPVHTDDTDLNVGMVDPGQSQTFTVTQKGTFGYHNHLDPSQTGTIQIN